MLCCIGHTGTIPPGRIDGLLGGRLNYIDCQTVVCKWDRSRLALIILQTNAPSYGLLTTPDYRILPRTNHKPNPHLENASP